MKEKNSYLTDNVIFLFTSFLVVYFQLWYIKIATVNVPIMDYWRYINEITENFFMGNLKITDFWKAFAGAQINPFIYLSLAANMKYFGLNTKIEIYLGFFMMVINLFLVYNYYIKTMSEKLKYNRVYAQLIFIGIALAIFNVNQWEILILQFSFSFMFRVLIYIIIFISVDKYLLSIEKKVRMIVSVGCMTFVTILSISGPYFPAMVGACFIAIGLYIVVNLRKLSIQEIKGVSIYALLVIVGVIIYISSIDSANGQNEITLMQMILNGNLIKSVVVLLGGSLVPEGLVTPFSGLIFYYIVGSFVVVMYAVAIIQFVMKKMWEHSFFPLMLMLYAMFSAVLIAYARIGIFGISYMTTSRYVCETTIGLIGIIWIIGDCVLQGSTFEKLRYKKLTSILGISVMFIIILMLTQAMLKEAKTAPYRKIYFERAIELVLNIDRAKDEELNIFQANTPEQVRKGVELMKKYGLGIFHSEIQLNEYAHLINEEIGNSLESANILYGVYDDSWAAEICEMEIRTGAKGEITVKGYYPNEITGKENITINVNGIKTSYVIEEQNFELLVAGPKDTVVTMVVKSDFYIVPETPDKRHLAFVLKDVLGE